MAFGAIAKPQPEHNFEGKVMLERVSKKVKAKQMSRNQRFTDDLHLNNDLKEGAWRNLVVDDQWADDLLDMIVDNYDLEEYEAERLTIYYCTFSDKNKKNIMS